MTCSEVSGILPSDIPPSSILRRSVTVWGVEVEVEFTFQAGYEATREDPGMEDELIVEAVFVDEIEITNLIGELAFRKIEQELFKMRED